MNMLIPIYRLNGPKQEIVKVEYLLRRKGLRFAVHRPCRYNRNKNQIWVVSELETGLQVCLGMSKKYVIKKAEKLIDKHYKKIPDKKDDFLKKSYRM